MPNTIVMCNACQKPFDEVHPWDWANDVIVCRDFNERNRPLLDPMMPISSDRNICRQNHTWREHVAESYGGRWFNPHFKVEVTV